MKLACGAAILVACLAASGARAGLAFTPKAICSKAGFATGSPFRDECVQRVFRERKANFWRDQGPLLALGAVAGIAASGGSAFAFMSRGAEPGVHRVDVGGEAFLVKVTGTPEATVRSATRYKNVRKADAPKWKLAAETVTGCSVSREVRDFDAFYVWLACSQPDVAARATPLSAPAAAPVQTVAIGSIADELGKLAALRDKGVLTEAEFQAQKTALLKKQRD